LRNTFLREVIARDIDGQVAKVLRGLGNPDPPLKLELARDLLRLDRQYYSTTDVGFLQEIAHRMRVAGKQILGRPMLLVEAVKSWDLKALLLPDQRRILLDSSLPIIKQRWGEAHEIGHSIIPWHDKFMQGDDRHTLRPACHEKLEAEANYGAARLIFLRDKFEAAILASELDFARVKALSRLFDNSMQTTLWRAVEFLDVPAVGVVSVHPKRPGDDFDPSNPCKYLIRSRSFEANFDRVLEAELFSILDGYCSYSKKGPIGSAEVGLTDSNGDRHIFYFDTFFNSHDALTLGVYRRRDSHSIFPMTQYA